MGNCPGSCTRPSNSNEIFTVQAPTPQLPAGKNMKDNRAKMILMCPNASVFGAKNPCNEILPVNWIC